MEALAQPGSTDALRSNNFLSDCLLACLTEAEYHSPIAAGRVRQAIFDLDPTLDLFCPLLAPSHDRAALTAYLTFLLPELAEISPEAANEVRQAVELLSDVAMVWQRAADDMAAAAQVLH